MSFARKMKRVQTNAEKKDVKKLRRKLRRLEAQRAEIERQQQNFRLPESAVAHLLAQGETGAYAAPTG